MNNSINPVQQARNNVSFQATIKTRLKGRANKEGTHVMDIISEKFKKLSDKAFPNDVLVIERTPDKIDGHDKHVIFAKANNGAETVIDEFKEVLSKDPNKISGKEATNVAKRLYNMFKLLRAENKLNAETSKIKDRLRKINYELKLNKNAVKQAKTDAERIKLENNPRTQDLKSKKEKLLIEMQKLEENHSNAINKLSDSDGYNLNTYSSLFAKDQIMN